MPILSGTFTRHLNFAVAALSLMKLILDSHNIKVTEAIKDHVSACVHKLEHMNPRALEARMNLERDHVGLPEKKYKCTLHLYFRGSDMFAEDHESDLYAAIDLVTKKVQQQLRKRQSKIITRLHGGAAKSKQSRMLADA